MLFLFVSHVIFATFEYQFGFKKQLSCRHAIYCVRNVIEHYVNNGSTVNVCSPDLSKAFDRINHYALFIKLMDRKLPNELLSLLEQWFSISVTWVRCCHRLLFPFFQPVGWCETRRSLVTYSLCYIHRRFGWQSEINRCWLLSVLSLCQYFFVCWRYIVNCAVSFCPADTVACLWV